MFDLKTFLEERKSGIGGSDAAALFNEGRGCRRRLILEKQGKEPDYPVVQELRWLERGMLLEPLAAQMYEQLSGHTAYTVGIRRMPGYPYLMVHTDRAIAAPDREEMGQLELKTMMREVFFAFKRDGMRGEHILQMQWGYMVVGDPWGVYGALWPDGWSMIYHPVEPNKEIMDACFKEGYIAWKEVQGELPLPARLNPNDKRCQVCPFRRSCQGEALLNILGGEVGRIDIDNSLPIQQAAEQYTEAKEILDNAEGLVQEARGELEKIMGDRTVLDTEGYRIYYRPQVSKRIDTKRLKKDHPTIVAGYEKETVSRPMRVFSK